MAEPANQDLQVEIERVTASVRLRVGADPGDTEIEQAVHEAFLRFESATVRQFVPLFAERMALSRLNNRRTLNP